MGNIALWAFLLLSSISEPESANSPDLIEPSPRKGPHVYKVITYIHHISDINVRDGDYKIELLLYAYSKNRRFDSLLIQKLAVKGAKEFTIVDVPLWIRKDSLQRRLFKINCTMIQKWNMKHYPFGKQQLDIVVYVMVPSNRVLLEDSAKLNYPVIGDTSDKRETLIYSVGNGWHFVKDLTRVHTDSIDDAFGRTDDVGRPVKYSALHYKIPLQEDNPGMLFIKLFLGMYVAFWVAYIALFIPVEREEPRFGLPVGGLFAAIANKYVIEALLPVSTDFNMVDTLHSITIVTIFLIIAYSALLLFFVEKKRSHELKNSNHPYLIFPDIRLFSMNIRKINFLIIALLTLAYVLINLIIVWNNCTAGAPPSLEGVKNF